MTTTEKREATRKRNAESRKRKEAEASRERSLSERTCSKCWRARTQPQRNGWKAPSS